MKSAELRHLFLSFFEQQGHQVLSSSPLVPGNDPTLLFTNAGMVQFKDVFLGQEHRPYTRATTAQRCVRAGGKHNDLENVGYTARHHTFFEMLGNFSFGDYFKREAIQFAWRFLTEVLQLPKEKFWVTVYQDDDEAAAIWLEEIGVSSERFSRCGEKDNFWSMGDTGPCGPCSEIFYDHGPDIAGGPPGSADADGDRYIEIWNLVFMQFNRDAEGRLSPLPKPSVDTGMGLERIAAVMQGVHNNYDIDIFQTLIDSIYRLTQGQQRNNPSFKVIADHIRSCAFLIVDSVLPGNEGRGYVLRRIIRRAARHGHKLGLTDKPFLYQLVKPLIEVMGDAYPELATQQAVIEQVLYQEEEQFLRTLTHGLKLLEADIENVSGQVISGETAFRLYDTYGFPLDLTADIAREHQLTVDMAGFEKAMTRQREQSQASSQFKGHLAQTTAPDATSEFTGYDRLEDVAHVLHLLDEHAKPLEQITAASGMVGVILDKTPFYAESGGQVGDTGLLQAPGFCLTVQDTHKAGNAIIHYGHVECGELRTGAKVDAKVDVTRRQAIRLNHSATHLLHAALKNVLGSHIQQKGSLVTEGRTRFDFSHFQPVTDMQLREIEQLVNQQIRQNYLVLTEEMPFDVARNSGAVALFGEKYGNTVRVLSMGNFSKELCGGTHVTRTGDIGLFRITSETGIASGIRRIEFVTGEGALSYNFEQSAVLSQLSQLLHASPSELCNKIDSLLGQQKQLEKESTALKAKLANNSSMALLDNVQKIGDFSVLLARLDQVEANTLRMSMDTLKGKLFKAAIVLVAVNDNKMNVIAGLTKDAVGQLPSAKTMVQLICGKGGGREDMAQGGGILVDNLDERFEAIKNAILEKV